MLDEHSARLARETHELRAQVVGKEDEVARLRVVHAEVVGKLEGEVEMLRGLGRKKDLGLERMGVLVAGWALRWKAVEGRAEGELRDEMST